MSTTSYTLKDSFILDSRSNIYVYNNRLRFISFIEAPSRDFLYTRNSTVPILGYSTILIKGTRPSSI